MRPCWIRLPFFAWSCICPQHSRQPQARQAPQMPVARRQPILQPQQHPPQLGDHAGWGQAVRAELARRQGQLHLHLQQVGSGSNRAAGTHVRMPRASGRLEGTGRSGGCRHVPRVAPTTPSRAADLGGAGVRGLLDVAGDSTTEPCRLRDAGERRRSCVESTRTCPLPLTPTHAPAERGSAPVEPTDTRNSQTDPRQTLCAVLGGWPGAAAEQVQRPAPPRGHGNTGTGEHGEAQAPLRPGTVPWSSRSSR